MERCFTSSILIKYRYLKVPICVKVYTISEHRYDHVDFLDKVIAVDNFNQICLYSMKKGIRNCYSTLYGYVLNTVCGGSLKFPISLKN
jgi:hypothetical protein